MPTGEQILAGLENIANQWKWLAVFWHVYLGGIMLMLIIGKRPSARLTGLLLVMPLFSVSGLAWSIGNPFNGTVFALVGLAAGVIALKLLREPVAVAPVWAVVTGGMLSGFGWVYPHFLSDARWWMYLYAAPVGLVPCPTLAVVIGLGLVVSGLNSRAWMLVIGIAGLCYGVFGAWRLAVTIDWVLFAGAAVLVFHSFRVQRSSDSGPARSAA